MTEPPDEPRAAAVADRPPPRAVADLDTASHLCPFLASLDGDWRSAVASKDHRCTAVEPSAALSLEKQRRLCLLEAHADCATFLAARRVLAGTSDAEDDGPEDDRRVEGRRDEHGARWALPRTAPVVLDRGRPSIGQLIAHRSTTQLALVLLMALAFIVLALARLSAGASDGTRPLVSPSPVGSPSPGSPSPAATISATAPAVAVSPIASPSWASSKPSAAPSAPATPTAAASAAAYRVVAGDTLYSIAARFGITVKALEQANGITDPSRLRIGTVLTIP